MAGSKKNVIFTVLSLVLIVTTLFVSYYITVVIRSSNIHAKHLGWDASTYKFDSVMGWSPIANSKANHTLANGKTVSVIFDDNGFRSVLNDTISITDNKNMLFLGCSFTHGYGVRQEDTFSQLIADELGYNCLNAGLSGGSILQMLLRARLEIPKHKPEIVIAQFSRWLPVRAKRYMAPTRYKLKANPYLYEKNDKVHYQKPFFESNFNEIESLKLKEYNDSNLLIFASKVGLPVYLQRDYVNSLLIFKRGLGLIPKSNMTESEIEEYCYRELQLICDTYNAELYLLDVPNYKGHPNNSGIEEKFNIIQTHKELRENIRQNDPRIWSKKYHFWSQDGSNRIDGHPNEEQHRIIADQAISYIRSN